MFYDRDGVSQNSMTKFNTPSDYARQNLFYLDMFGHYWCHSSYHIENRLLDNYLIILTVNGSGTVVTHTGEYLCQRMDLILIDSSAEHHYHANDNWEFYWLHFQGGSSKELTRYIFESGCDFTHVEETSLSVHSFIQLIQKGGGTAIDAEISVSALIHQLLADMIHQAQSGRRLTKEPSRIAEAIAYIEKHFSEDIRLDRLAQTFLLSKSSFCHKFKHETGLSPYDYLLTTRINQAKYLLKTTHQSIAEISLAVGFQSEVNFTRHFKKKNGITPSAFRQIIL